MRKKEKKICNLGRRLNEHSFLFLLFCHSHQPYSLPSQNLSPSLSLYPLSQSERERKEERGKSSLISLSLSLAVMFHPWNVINVKMKGCWTDWKGKRKDEREKKKDKRETEKG